MRGVAMGIDWSNTAMVRQLANEALGRSSEENLRYLRSRDRRQRMLGELSALSVLMLKTMKESAEQGMHTHGGPVWKAFGKALIEEYDHQYPGNGAGKK